MKKNSVFAAIKNHFVIIGFILLMITINSCSFFDSSKQKALESELSITKVMTFNIRYGSAKDSDNSWQYRKNLVFDVIRDENPDLIGLQEAEKFQIDELLENIHEYDFVGVGRDDGITAGEHSPIFFSKHRFILDTSATFWFSETPHIPGSKSWGNKIPRICTWAKLFDKFSGNEIYVFNVHLDHQSVPSRIKSTEALISFVKTLPQSSSIILTGDFNSDEKEQTIQQILKFGLIDSYRVLHKKSPNEGTFHSFLGDDSKDKIDYIFSSNNMKSIDAEIIKTNIEGKYPSDHFPVTAKLIFKE